MCFCHESALYDTHSQTSSNESYRKYLYPIRLANKLTDSVWFVVIESSFVSTIWMFWIGCVAISTCLSFLVKLTGVCGKLLMGSYFQLFRAYQSLLVNLHCLTGTFFASNWAKQLHRLDLALPRVDIFSNKLQLSILVVSLTMLE